jgi:hypothetical protein
MAFIPGMLDTMDTLYEYLTLLSPPPQNIENSGKMPVPSQELNSRQSL